MRTTLFLYVAILIFVLPSKARTSKSYMVPLASEHTLMLIFLLQHTFIIEAMERRNTPQIGVRSPVQAILTQADENRDYAFSSVWYGSGKVSPNVANNGSI